MELKYILFYTVFILTCVEIRLCSPTPIPSACHKDDAGARVLESIQSIRQQLTCTKLHISCHFTQRITLLQNGSMPSLHAKISIYWLIFISAFASMIFVHYSFIMAVCMRIESMPASASLLSFYHENAIERLEHFKTQEAFENTCRKE
ncbi:unnamed protein product [Albugo candida]|uniref:Uncharacterized protein n=1 Tax=Albugo candida TaxID=65357 RepID=A0A024GQU6_9STRA|nr:unnamed protein product [Albugo candida]|eukprot:CCI49097.1 unnamed protein product [Albugo candida]